MHDQFLIFSQAIKKDIYVLQRHDGQYSDKYERIVCCSFDVQYAKRLLIREFLSYKYRDSYWVVHKVQTDIHHEFEDAWYGKGERLRQHPVALTDDIVEMYTESVSNAWKAERLGLLDVIREECDRDNDDIPGYFIEILMRFDAVESKELIATCQEYTEQNSHDQETIRSYSKWATKNKKQVIEKMIAFATREHKTLQICTFMGI